MLAKASRCRQRRGQQGEPALDHVEPGGRCWREVQVPARALDEPFVHEARLVGGGVVEHHVDVEVSGHRGLDLIEEGAEFARAVPAFAGADQRARVAKFVQVAPDRLRRHR